MTGAGLFLRLTQRQILVVEAFGRESGRCCPTLILVRPNAKMRRVTIVVSAPAYHSFMIVCLTDLRSNLGQVEIFQP